MRAKYFLPVGGRQTVFSSNAFSMSSLIPDWGLYTLLQLKCWS